MQVIEHLSGKERESGSHKGPKESVCSNCGGSTVLKISLSMYQSHGKARGKARGKNLQHEIRVNYVVEELDEDSEQTKAGEQTRQRRNDPMD
jgi:hypothetical protein